MNEMMIQEAVLNSIDQLNETQLFTEYDVLMSMNAVYMKSAMIQEAAGVTFDGYGIVQEAADDADADAGEKKTGKLSRAKKKFMSLKFIQWIIRAIDWCKRQLGKIFGKKKTATAAQQKNLAANVDSMTVEGKPVDVTASSKYDAGELNKVVNKKEGIDTKLTEVDDNKYINGNFQGTIELRKINISGFNLIADIDTIEKAVDAFNNAAEMFAQYSALSPAAGSDELKNVAKIGAGAGNVIKLCDKAVDIASKKKYGDSNFGDLYYKIYQLGQQLDKAKKSFESFVKSQKTSDYYDDNLNKISAAQYQKNLTDDDRANLTDAQKATLNRDIDRDFATKEMTRASAKLTNLIVSTMSCLDKMLTADPKSFAAYLDDTAAKLKKQAKAAADAKPTMPSI